MWDFFSRWHLPRVLAVDVARRWGAVCLTVAVASVAIVAAPPSGQADLKLCNMTASRVGVAVGYKDQNGWVAEGWWNVLSHSCETLFLGELKARFYYIHAVDYDRGGEWAGKALMCTGSKAFTIRGVESCDKRGYKRTGFFEVDTGEANDWTIRLTDPDDGKSASATSQ